MISDRSRHDGCGSATAGESTGAEAGPKASRRFHAASPLDPLLDDLRALRVYVGHYLTARADAATAQARRLGLWMVAGAIGALAGATAVVVAVALLLLGIANALAALFGSLWLGQLVTGILVLAILAGTVYWTIRRTLQSFSQKTKRKYEHRRHEEHTAVGQDVDERATERGIRA